MTSITIPGSAVGLPSRRRLSFDRTRWLRYGLGVAIAGLLAADVTVLVNELRGDDPAGVSRQAPAEVAPSGASPATTGSSGSRSTSGGPGAVGGSGALPTDPAATTVVVPAEPVPSFGSAATATIPSGTTGTPRTNVGTGGTGGNTAPPSVDGGRLLDPVTDAVNGLPVVGEVVGPVVEDVADQLPPVEDELPADTGTGALDVPVEVPVSVPVSVPSSVGGLLP